MRDLTGFAILLVAIVLLIYLLVQVVFPFVITYLAGVVMFMIGVAILLRNGRFHPVHLPNLLNPGLAPAIAVLAVVAPLAHAAIFAAGSDWWPLVLAVNAIPTLSWSAHLLVLHRREKARYFAEGHDIEDLIASARARESALEVRADVMESVLAERHEPQPWEMVAGEAIATLADPSKVLYEPLLKIRELQTRYRPIVERLEAMAKEPSFTELDALRSELASLDVHFREVMSTSENALSRTMAGRLAGWDEVT